MIDFDFYNLVIPKKGCLLLSNPELPDRIFHRSVILLCEHDKNGTLGFILNKKSMTQVSEALESLDEIDEKLHYGGPVDMNGVYIIHRAEIPNRINILNGIFYGGDINSLSSLFNTKQIGSNDIKFFLGYSSWIPNQLTFELKRRSWVIYENATPELIFEMNEDEMWKKILYDMGDKYKVFANYPDNPSLN